MIDPAILLPYILACLLFSIVPGPSVTVGLANALSAGTRAGLLTIVGTEIAMLAMITIVAFGMQAVMAAVSGAFDVIKLVGAVYLAWLGFRMFTSRGHLEVADGAPRRRAGAYIRQGALINLSNPKTLLFLGAFLPQFVDLSRPAFGQIMVLGLIVMTVATTTDILYAILAGQARGWLSATRLRLMNRVSGAILMVGAVWLALQRRA